MSDPGQKRPERAGGRSGHVRRASKAEAVTQYQQLRDKPFKLRNGSLEIMRASSAIASGPVLICPTGFPRENLSSPF